MEFAWGGAYPGTDGGSGIDFLDEIKIDNKKDAQIPFAQNSTPSFQ